MRFFNKNTRYVCYFNITHVGFHCFLFSRKFSWRLSFTHVRERHPKREDSHNSCLQILSFILARPNRAWPEVPSSPPPPPPHDARPFYSLPQASPAPPAPHGRHQVSDRQSGHIQPICPLMPVPGSGRRSPLLR